MTQPLATRPRLRNTRPEFQASRRLRASGDVECFGPAGPVGCVAIVRVPGAGASQWLLMTSVDLRGFSRLHGSARMPIGPGRFPRPDRPQSPDIPHCTRLRFRLFPETSSAMQIICCNNRVADLAYGRQMPAATGRSHIPALLLVAGLVGGCSGDDPETALRSEAADGSSVGLGSAAQALPHYFPEQIPLPGEYLIVRNSSRTTEESGPEIAMNIAPPGRLEDVEFAEDRISLEWRFRGQGFERASLYLNYNQGYLDRGATDSTHLPVMLTITMSRYRSGP